ncbi:MAG: hypothetical protein ACRDT6_29260 [Micromonosporaceae bacterium]
MAAGRTFGAVVAMLALVPLAGCGGAAGEEPRSAPSDTRPVGTVTDATLHGHKLRDIPAEGAPSVTVRVTPDPHGGWNVALTTPGFRFTPDQVNREVAAGTGHAHIYVDGTKYARLYAPWYHLPASAIGAGDHQVWVTLNANDHTVWAVSGKAITATVKVTGEASPGHSDGHNGHSHTHAPSSSG